MIKKEKKKRESIFQSQRQIKVGVTMHNSDRAGSASDKKAKEKLKKNGLPRESGKICALVSSERVFQILFKVCRAVYTPPEGKR